MRCVGLIDITVGNAKRLGASQRSTTRRCASHYIATQRANRWGHPAALVRLARTVTLKRLWLRDGMCSVQFFVAQSWAECITNMPGFNLRQAKPTDYGLRSDDCKCAIHLGKQSADASRNQPVNRNKSKPLRIGVGLARRSTIFTASASAAMAKSPLCRATSSKPTCQVTSRKGKATRVIISSVILHKPIIGRNTGRPRPKCGRLLRRYYRPTNFGFRFSAKAVIPSFISSEKFRR
jgi:hypothetical protein